MIVFLHWGNIGGMSELLRYKIPAILAFLANSTHLHPEVSLTSGSRDKLTESYQLISYLGRRD